MAFDDLPKRPAPLFAAAAHYADTVLDASRGVAFGGDVAFTGDLAFGQDYFQKLDIYAPLDVAAPLPILIFIHGGAFIGGYKEWMGFMAPAILAAPALLVSLSYRLAPENPFPAAVEDVASATAWVYQNVSQFGGDPDRIFIGGHSAGGHLASLVALDDRWLAKHALPRSILKGVIPVSAPLDMDFDAIYPSDSPPVMMRKTFIPCDEDVVVANPIAQITSDAPPFYLAAGGDDLWMLSDDMGRFAAALRGRGVFAFDEVFEGHDHFETSMRFGAQGHPWMERVIALLRTGVPVQV